MSSLKDRCVLKIRMRTVYRKCTNYCSQDVWTVISEIDMTTFCNPLRMRSSYRWKKGLRCACSGVEQRK